MNHNSHSSDMYLQPGLKEPALNTTLNIALNSQADRSSFPPNGTNPTTTFNQLGPGQSRIGPFLSQSTGPTNDSSVSFAFSEEGCSSYLSSSSGDYSMVG